MRNDQHTVRRLTPITDEMKREMRIAIARMGGIQATAMITGIQEKVLSNILNCSQFITEDVFDHFCCTADTDLWVTNYEWYTYAELQEMGLWTTRGVGTKPKEEDDGRVYVSPHYSPEALFGVERGEAGNFISPRSDSHGDGGADSDQDPPRPATD